MLIGECWVRGDHACEAGDVAALRAVAVEVLERAREPLFSELRRLVEDCADPERATAAWTRLKRALQDSGW